MHGRLGLATNKNELRPMPLPLSQQLQISYVFFGVSTSFAICSSGVILCWGSGQEGKLGLDYSSDTYYTEPRKMASLLFGDDLVS